jgi:nitrite reductase (NO-forming)
MKLQRRHLLAGSAVTLAAALVGLGAFALLGGLDRNVVERVHGGGTRVVRVALVDAVVGFDVTPDKVVVERGAHVVLDVVNEGQRRTISRCWAASVRGGSPRESQRLDLGAVRSGLPELYCTLPGHRLAGMTLDIRAGSAQLD